MKPMEIEKRSFEIIAEELAQKYPGQTLDPSLDLVVRRVIHTTADFEYFETLTFSEGAVEKMKRAIESGCHIVTDTTMALSGINKAALKRHGCEACCFIADPDVAEAAKAAGSTRAVQAMEKAAKLDRPLIFAIGNAPTALIHIYEMIQEGRLDPRLVIGVPVGFVNVVQSKELIMTADVPYIVARGRKGGSNAAAAICNALLYMLGR